MAEYAMLLALITVSTAAAIQALRGQIDVILNLSVSALSTANN